MNRTAYVVGLFNRKSGQLFDAMFVSEEHPTVMNVATTTTRVLAKATGRDYHSARKKVLQWVKLHGRHLMDFKSMKREFA